MNAMTSVKDANDLVTEEVVRMAIRQITLEMASVVKRISGSPIITESDDYGSMIYGPDGELLDAPTGPMFTGPGGQCLRKFLAQFGHNGFVDGDVFLANDPFTTGAVHANDMQIITPVFLGERCVGFAYMHAHVMDVGGIVPGSWGVGARDCFAEAFRLPFVRYLNAGRVDETIRAIIARNTRLPDLVLNDIHGLATATRMGGRQLRDLVARYGADEFQRLTRSILDRTEGAARSRLATLTPATYELVDWMEHNGHVDDLYAIRSRLIVTPERLAFAYTGDPQTDGFVNGTASSGVGQIAAAVMSQLYYDIPLNEGILRTFSLEAEAGTVVNATEPAPVSSNHLEAGFKQHTLAWRLVSTAMQTSTDAEVRRRGFAPFASSVTMATFAGLDRNGVYTIFADMSGMGAGGGGGPSQDGMDVSCTQQAASIRMPDIESMEEAFPIIYLWRRLGVDSGGPGEHRGGVGVDVAWAPYRTESLTGVLNSASGHIPALGLTGGYPGGTTRCERIEGFDVQRTWFASGRMPGPDDVPTCDVLPIKASGVPMKKDDVFRLRMPGGGGWGDPLDRDPNAVVRDVRIGAVSVAQAASAYGVVLTEAGASHDELATRELREQIRGRRRDHARPTLLTTVGGCCRHCGVTVKADDWIANSGGLAEQMDRLGVYAAPYPGVQLHEIVCPNCGASDEVRDAAPGQPPPFTVMERIW